MQIGQYCGNEVQPGPNFDSAADADIRYSLFDVDATLITPQSMDLPTERFLSAAHEAGKSIVLGIVSARNLAGTAYIIQAGQLKGLSILDNGARIYDSSEDEMKVERSMPVETTEEITRFLRYKNYDHGFNDDGTWFQSIKGGYYRLTAGAGLFNPKDNLVLPSVELHQPLVVSVHKLTLSEVEELIDFGQQYQDRHIAVNVVHEHLGKDGLKLYDIFFSDYRAKKDIALEDASEISGIDLSNIMMTGDGLNDKDIISRAKVGVAMGNAADDVKSVATHIAPAYDKDGAAISLEELVLRSRIVK